MAIASKSNMEKASQESLKQVGLRSLLRWEEKSSQSLSRKQKLARGGQRQTRDEEAREKVTSGGKCEEQYRGEHGQLRRAMKR